jgi:hypothetical protein
MNKKVEHSNTMYRDGDTNVAEVRATSKFSSNEVREILSRTGMKDLRQLGCPAWIFERVLESRAKQINFRSSEPAPAPSPDLSERLQSISLF